MHDHGRLMSAGQLCPNYLSDLFTGSCRQSAQCSFNLDIFTYNYIAFSIFQKPVSGCNSRQEYNTYYIH